MGLNLDLEKMLGLPHTVECPRCKQDVITFFDDYDVECGDPNPSPGRWDLDLHCDECDHEWSFKFEVTVSEKAAEYA